MEYLTRQQQIREKYVARHKYLLDCNDLQFDGKIIYIDSSNQDIEKLIPQNMTRLNYKYETILPPVDYDCDVIIINPGLSGDIKTDSHRVIESKLHFLPIEQRRFLDDYVTREQKLQLIYSTVMAQLNEEKDILIYCADANEIDHLRYLFDSQSIRVVIKIDKYMDEISELVWPTTKYHQNTVYLLLEPQQLESSNITLIIHSDVREMIYREQDNTMIYSFKKLSQFDLQVREISKSSNEAVMICYAFSEQEYLQLSMKAEQSTIDDEHFEKLLYQVSKTENLRNLQKFGILVAALTTSGQLLSNIDPNTLNHQLTVKSSQCWSKQGDYHSWYNIVMQFVIHFNDSPESALKFCVENRVNLTKILLILAKLKYFASLYQIHDLDLVGELQPIGLQKQSSSFDAIATDNDYQLKQLFPILDIKPHPDSLLRIFKTSIPNYILGVKDGKALYYSQTEQRQRKTSFQEHIIQNVCSAVMNQLWNGEESEVSKLETQFQSQIEPFNSNNIIIFSDNGKQVDDALSVIIGNIKESLKQQTKDYEYQNSNIRFVLQNGGLIKNCYYSQNSLLIISNLPVETTSNQIKNLLQPYTNINQITLIPTKTQQMAQIDITDKESTAEIINDLDETEFQGNIIRLTSTLVANEHERKFQPFIIKLTWFIYHCKGKAELVFNTPETSSQFYNEFNGKILDGKQMQMQLNDNLVTINNLSQHTTELDLQRMSRNIKQINISKSILYEPKFDIFQKVETLLSEEARGHKFGGRSSHIFRIRNQRKDYKRILKLAVPSIEFVTTALESLNNNLIQIGLQQVKLYCEAKYRHQFIVKLELSRFVQNNLKKLANKFGDLFNIKQIERSSAEIELFLESDNNIVFAKVRDTIQSIVEGYLVNFGELNRVLLSDFGQKFLRDLERTCSVIFNIDDFKKTIMVFCLDEQYQELQDKIKKFLESNSSIIVNLTPQKLKKLIGADGKGLQFLQEKFNLTEVVPLKKLNQLQISGIAANLENAIVQIEQFLESKDQNIEESGSTQNTCSYCLMYMKYPYILSNCNHKLCQECLSFDFCNAIKDVASLPVKCPICQELVLLEDIQNLLGVNNYQKFIDISINKYVNDNRDSLMFCFSPGCSNINRIKGTTMYCESCKINYCLKCKVQMHYGLTCWEYQTGDQKVMLELMKKEDIRYCPECRSLAQKISGCMSVTCASCKKCICWKDDKSGKPCMKVFATSRECHQHLTDVHGGYY